MALSEYMPYGAPELMDGARSRMARSTALASVGVVMLVVCLGAIATHGFTRQPALPEIGSIFMLDPPPSLADPMNYAPPRIGTTRPMLDPNALVRAVPELPELKEPEPMRPFTEMPGAPGANDVSGTSAHGLVSGTSLPVIGEEPELGHPVFVDEYPNVVRCAEPRYPDLAREAGVEGTVHVHMLVGLDGRVRRAVIAQGGSVPMLDEAALDAARTCVFTPALTNRHPVMVWVSRSYHFSLH